MKVGFYLDNNSHKNVDYSNPRNGNPGIGGTHFMIWSIAFYLNEINKDIDIYILAPQVDNLPESTKNIYCKDIYDAAQKSKQYDIDIFIFRGPNCNEDLYNLIDKLKLKSIMWCHNFEDAKSMKLASKCKYLKKNVCVGREQYDRLRDHEIISKTTYIYNALDFSGYKEYGTNKKDNIICYIGSIIPSKGFHILAKNWRYIKKKIPDAQLYVIGGGRLYDKKAQLGKYKIAEERYEKKFIKYLLDNNGNINKDVKFFGVLGGEEKLQVMSKAKVGVPNPTAKTETFGIGAIEFQALGIPVVTRRKNGYLDTVDICTGILSPNKRLIKKEIVKLLKDEKKYNQMSSNCRRFVEEQFNIQLICDKWRLLLENVLEDEYETEILEPTNYLNKLKVIRELNRKLKCTKIFYKLPSIIDYEYWCKNIIKGILNRR